MKKRKRERWDSRTAFILAAVGSAIGLGNVWRFPFVCQQNGGGAFLVPYFVALITAGIPIMMLEFALGAKMQAGAAKAFQKLKGGFEFLGWWAVLISAVIVFYYCAIMAWAWNYLYHSLGTSWKGDESSFFYSEILQISDNPAQFDGIPMALVVGLALTWIVVFLCLVKGAESVSKVVLITVPLPWILLVILFFRGMTLPGAFEGVRYYLTPDWSALLHAKTWLAAYGQIFFSLSLAFGVMITYASFLPKRSDTNNNAFITSFANCGTSFFAGFVVFSIIGFMTMTMGIPAESLSGPGLAFITYPTAIAQLPALQVMVGVFFFLMLLTLGIDSAFSLVEAVSTSFSEKLGLRKLSVTAGFCVIGFMIGLIFISKAGLYWLDIVDHYINNYAVTVVGLLECVFIGWFGYLKLLKAHANKVSEFKAGIWWDIFVKGVTPIVLGIIIVIAFADDFSAPYGAGAPPAAEDLAYVAAYQAPCFENADSIERYLWDWDMDEQNDSSSKGIDVYSTFDAEFTEDAKVIAFYDDGTKDARDVKAVKSIKLIVGGLMVRDKGKAEYSGSLHSAAKREIELTAETIGSGNQIVKYDWDWDGDGTYDESSEGPNVSHTWENPGNSIVIVKATDVLGNEHHAAVGVAAGYSLWARIVGGWLVVGGIILIAIVMSLIKDRKPPEGESEVCNA